MLVKRVIYVFLLLLGLTTALILVPTSRNFLLKQWLEYKLSTSSIKVKIASLSVTADKIEAKNTEVRSHGQSLASVETIVLDYNLNKLMSNEPSDMVATFGERASILGKEAVVSAKVQYRGKYNGKGQITLTIDKIESAIFSDFGLHPFTGYCNIARSDKSMHIRECKITDGASHLTIDAQIDKDSKGSLESLYIKGDAKDMPIDLHKAFHHAMAPNDTMQYLYENISGATLLNGAWEINFDEEFFRTFKMKPEYIKGNFKLDNIKLAYDPDFPPLEKIKTELVMTGSVLDFKIPSAYSGKTLLSNASVVIDWGVEGDTEVIIDADGKGSAADLTSFIPQAQLAALKEDNIDLRAIKGDAVSKVHIVVPLGEKKNSYNITTTLSNLSLSILEGSVSLTNAKLKGLFDGEIVKIEGPALLNNFNSQISITQYLEPETEHDIIITSNITLAPTATGLMKSAFYEVKSGKALLNFIYKKKNEKVEVLTQSNLTGLEFVIGKLGVYKPAGDKAYLEINNKGAVSLNPVNIKIYGDKDFKIIGNAEIGAKITKINLAKIRSNDTDLRADIAASPKDVSVKVRGKSLDLSHSNMMQFLTKNVDKTATNLDIKLDKVRLKSEVILTDFLMNIHCDTVGCDKGAMVSHLMDKNSFTMELSKKDDYELWKIKTDNAGAVFKGIGMLDNVKGGYLDMDIETHRYDITAGQQIPIVNGNFTLTKFVTLDNKFLTRLVSIVSLPGLMSVVINNKNISFSKMTGQFSYKDDVLTIFDGAASGPFLDFSMKGNVFTKEKKIKIKGQVIPSLYGLSSVLNNIPIVSTILKGKHRKGVFVAPYSMEYKYN